MSDSLKLAHFGIIFLSILRASWTSIKIQINDKTVVEWSGCIFKRFPIYPNESSPCSNCTLNGEQFAKFDDAATPPSEKYRNCTKHCHYPTICTEYKYDLDVIRPKCYQCEQEQKEVIKFRALRSYKICSVECKECAKDADLSTAVYCSLKCKGTPTFCYPVEMWFGHHKCYQSTMMFGCNFKRVVDASVTVACLECGLIAKDRLEAQQCAYECHGIPTYHETDQRGKPVLLQCQIGSYHEVFEHSLPQKILNFLKIETPLGVSKAIRFLKLVPKVGNVSKLAFA